MKPHRHPATALSVCLSSAALLGTALAAGPARATDDADVTATVRHTHTSGFGPAAPATWERDMDVLMQGADVITATEVRSRARADVLLEEGWTRVWFAGPGDAENGIAVRSSVWTVESAEARQLTGYSYTYGSGQRAPEPHATTALLRHVETGRTLLVSTAHLPSMIEGRRALRRDDPARTRTARTMVAGWIRHVAAQRQALLPDAAIVNADWNLDLKRWWVRAWQRDRWGTDYAPMFRPEYPARGTHEGGMMSATRIIDYAFGSGLRLAAPSRILRDVASSDHHPVRTTATIG